MPAAESLFPLCLHVAWLMHVTNERTFCLLHRIMWSGAPC